jgi:putative hydrolase of the HAD superfamily
MPIKNLIFDFGGVLLDISPESCKAAFIQLGFEGITELLSMTHQKGFCDQFERGLLTREEFLNKMREHIGTNVPDEAIVEAWCKMAVGIPAEKLHFIHCLKAEGYHVSALSNTNPIHWKYCRQFFLQAGHDPQELFEHVWLSYEMHLAKPDAEIFRDVIRDSGYRPEETLFIDDSGLNCEVAAQLGIHTYQAPVRADWRDELREKLAER